MGGHFSDEALSWAKNLEWAERYAEQSSDDFGFEVVKPVKITPKKEEKK